MTANRTIAAIATPPGDSLTGIIRLSGEDALGVASRCAAEAAALAGTIATLPTWHLTHGMLRLTLVERQQLCPAIFYVMRAPRSYTGEDIVEIHLPGAAVLIKAALRAVLAAGATLAEAGEFTLRAFMNGRIDLGQAEAVERIIAARAEGERRAALSRLGHELTRRIATWRHALTDLAANVEASLDLDEAEIDVSFTAGREDTLANLARDCQELANTATTDTPQRDGIRVRLAGLTNAGKSSLLNALAGREVTVVAATNSTTRDRISAAVVIGRFHFVIEDTAGFDPTGNGLEREASELSRRTLGEAPLICLVVDSTTTATADWEELARGLERLNPARVGVILVLNKIDLPAVLPADEFVRRLQEIIGVKPCEVLKVSARTGAGLTELRAALEAVAMGDLALSGAGEVSAREGLELAVAAKACEQARAGLAAGDGMELVAFELRTAHEALSRVAGEGYAEEILGSIFSRFCVGK